MTYFCVTSVNKINIVFLPLLGYNYDYYIHLDADSVLTNPLDFESYNDNFDFGILQGSIYDCKNDDQMKIAHQYAFNPSDFKEYQFDENQIYFFSSSHIIFHKNIFPILEPVLKKHRFEMNKDFSKDKRLKFGDQGFLNFAINELSYRNLIKVKLDNCAIFGYEDKSNYPKLTLDNIVKKEDTKIAIIHYTGSSRKAFLNKHNYGEILTYFVKKFDNNTFNFLTNETSRIIIFYKNWFMKRFSHKIKIIA